MSAGLLRRPPSRLAGAPSSSRGAAGAPRSGRARSPRGACRRRCARHSSAALRGTTACPASSCPGKRLRTGARRERRRTPRARPRRLRALPRTIPRARRRSRSEARVRARASGCRPSAASRRSAPARAPRASGRPTTAARTSTEPASRRLIARGSPAVTKPTIPAATFTLTWPSELPGSIPAARSALRRSRLVSSSRSTATSPTSSAEDNATRPRVSRRERSGSTGQP